MNTKNELTELLILTTITESLYLTEQDRTQCALWVQLPWKSFKKKYSENFNNFVTMIANRWMCIQKFSSPRKFCTRACSRPHS